MDGAGGRDGLLLGELKLLEVLFRGRRVRLAVLSLVLALLRRAKEALHLGRCDDAVAHKLVQVAAVSAQVFPGEHRLVAALPDLNAEAQSLVEQKRLFVTFAHECVNLGVLSFFVCEQLSFSFLEDALDDELVLVILVGPSDANGRVLEDEL